MHESEATGGNSKNKYEVLKQECTNYLKDSHTLERRKTSSAAIISILEDSDVNNLLSGPQKGALKELKDSDHKSEKARERDYNIVTAMETFAESQLLA